MTSPDWHRHHEDHRCRRRVVHGRRIRLAGICWRIRAFPRRFRAKASWLIGSPRLGLRDELKRGHLPATVGAVQCLALGFGSTVRAVHSVPPKFRYCVLPGHFFPVHVPKTARSSKTLHYFEKNFENFSVGKRRPWLAADWLWIIAHTKGPHHVNMMGS